MSMLPQPPPDAPAPPPSRAAIRSRRKLKWLWIVGLFSMVFVTVLLSPFFLFGHRHHHGERIEAVNNARQVGLALFEFETVYGKFPDATTIPALRKETGTLLTFGTTTSNDYFRQLIGAEIAQSEVMFYAKTAGGRKPDNVFDTTHALDKRECGFTYLVGGTTATDNPRRPIVVAPMIPGTDRFDPKPFEGRAVVLKIDNSVTSLPIDKHGHVLVDGRNLMDPHHPIWDGHAPVIAWPDL